MGFGTGHHATTRLCLAALQTVDSPVASCSTSGRDPASSRSPLACSAPARAVGIDSDPDAIQSAQREPRAQPRARRVGFRSVDLAVAHLPAARRAGRGSADVIVANLTGACSSGREAPVALDSRRQSLIVSGCSTTSAIGSSECASAHHPCSSVEARKTAGRAGRSTVEKLIDSERRSNRRASSV